MQRHGNVAGRTTGAGSVTGRERLAGGWRRAGGQRRVRARIAGEEVFEAAILLDDDDDVLQVFARGAGAVAERTKAGPADRRLRSAAGSEDRKSGAGDEQEPTDCYTVERRILRLGSTPRGTRFPGSCIRQSSRHTCSV